VTDLIKPSQMSLPKIYCLSSSEIGVRVSVLVVLDTKAVNLCGFCTVRAQIYLATELIVCLFVCFFPHVLYFLQDMGIYQSHIIIVEGTQRSF
jgi:hypothetical protein